MGKNELTKEEAFKLISAVIDNEVSEEKRKAFMEFIERDDEIRREYQSIKKIKSLVSSRCPYAKAPESLQKYVQNICEEELSEEKHVPVYDKPCINPGRQVQHIGETEVASQKAHQRWIYSIAAGLLLIAALWSFFNFYGPVPDSQQVYNLEEYAYEHFQKNEGQLISPNIATASLGSAEMRLAQDFNMPMRVPDLEKAELKGIAYVDFVPNYKAPMIEYYLPDEDQYIYIFAFRLDKLKKFKQITLDQEAVKKCDKPKDYYIHEVNNKHVVSWKWNNIWYAAVSNHNGDTLASFVKTLQPDSEVASQN